MNEGLDVKGKKIATVVGARPQFIKAAAVSRAIRGAHTEVLIHTGQHYDPNMSDIFFSELHIPTPDYNLGIGSGTHGAQTGAMLAALEKVLARERPDAVIVYGDTNSTLAAALTAAKLRVPVAHIEAGLRSYDRRMPEEINRVMTDHVSSWLFCPTETAVLNLKKEGIAEQVFLVGDVMCDAVRFFGAQAERYNSGTPLEFLYRPAQMPGRYYLATIHRAENTDGEANLSQILTAFERLDHPVVFPVHPRTRALVDSLYRKNEFLNILFVQPLGYPLMLHLARGAVKVITDSGGLQKEAYMLRTPCVTVRGQT